MGESGGVEILIPSRPAGADTLRVDRVLPYVKRRHLGPFVFLDHFGPHTLPAGDGLDVRPHPHIGLATVTYLFEGEIVHRDSLGIEQVIGPGAVNWMTAGRGIVHSERSPTPAREQGPRLHGLQLWIALPDEAEEIEPAFHHHPGSTLPEFTFGAVRGRLLVGEAWGLRSPVQPLSPTLYAEARIPAGASLPLPGNVDELGVYVVSGTVRCGTDTIPARTLGVVQPGTAEVVAEEEAVVALLGGSSVGPRHIWWNLVSSRPERIEAAARDWKAGRFPVVPGETEFIPLPEGLAFPWAPRA